MQQRSAQVSGRKWIETSDYETEAEVHSRDDKETVQATPKKSRRKKRKTLEDRDAAHPVRKAKKKRGILRQLVEMPIDVLFEIFGHLKPLDLVNMARTTKDLRALLMSRSSISVWRTARSSISGLPDCPNDLSEPQYATLAFGKSCSFCHRNLSIVHVSWSARVRCCNKCLDIHFKVIQSPTNWGETRQYPSSLAPWIPCLKITRQVSRRARSAAHVVRHYLCEVDQQWGDQYVALKSPQSKHDWLRRRLEERYAIEKHARDCERWYIFDAFGQHDPFHPDYVIAKGKDEVLDYIRGLGFEEDLYKIRPMVDAHPIDFPSVEEVCRKPLTPSILLTLKPYLIAGMENYRRQRQINELKDLLETRIPLLSEVHAKGIQSLPINAVYPKLYDLYVIAEEHDFMDYSKSTSDALRVSFGDVVTLWKSKVESKLIDLIGKACGLGYVFDQARVFDLATTFFKCSSCHETGLMRHERTMMHSCATRTRAITHESPLAQRASMVVFRQSQWGDIGSITFSKVGLVTVSEVVAMAGLDPKTATARDMDERDPIYECRTSNSINAGRATMKWDTVVNHRKMEHLSIPNITRPPMVLQLLTEPEASKVRERIKEQQERSTYQGECKILCPHCRSTENNINVYRKHLKEKHEVKRVKYSDLVFSLDQNRILPMYRLWPPREENSDDED